MYNPTFKRPGSHCRPGRSPSPPGRFVEPLSPSFDARTIDSRFAFSAHGGHPDHTEGSAGYAYGEKFQSSGQKRGHNRSGSNIATLADIALATSPTYQAAKPALPDYSTGRRNDDLHGAGEPPHKRTRSELFGSPQIPQYAARPATSYETMNYTNAARQVQARESYESRVEEAALLLNFRGGGWPSSGSALSPPQTYAGEFAHPPRPHADSFSHELARPLPAGLAPPGAHDEKLPQQSSLPSPPRRDSDAVHPAAKQEGDPAISLHAIPETSAQPSRSTTQQTRTPPNDSDGVDVSMSEASEVAPVKKRRGWPKGKPRGTGSRKTLAEKAATKKAANRRKTTDAKAKAKAAASSPEELPRRHSLSDIYNRAAVTLEDHRRAKSVPRDTQMIIRPAPRGRPARRKGSPEVSCAGCAIERNAADSNGELKDEWISCNGCKQWFHVDCAGFKNMLEVRDVDKYFCKTCEPQHGKTTYVRKSARAHVSVDYAELQRGVLKTSEESMEHHYIQPIKDGTFQFDSEYFPRMPPELVTKDFFERGGFTEPICIPAALNPRPWLERARSRGSTHETGDGNASSDGNMGMMPEDFEYDALQDVNQDKLDMVMPENLTVRQVCELVGPDTPLDVIDVKTQHSGGKKWNLKRWADYYDEVGDKQIRNVISLEVSQTKLGRLLRRPKVVREIDLQDQVWPAKETEQGKWPKVQFYCLMSVADSYTDFHIDFGGSSVYYHILKGQKTFFFIPPKPKHLKAYEEWNDSPEQNYTFLPDITKECYRVDLGPGDTMLIPSGWIHAVWTPATSLVIGGNFLTRMSFRNQFRVYEIEKANNTPLKFRYPYFMRLMWYTAIQYLDQDPLPIEVTDLFLEGKQYERDIPIWADFDGDLAREDPRPGARNQRYYSQAELDGLPDLVNFIFRSVMLVMGRIEGVSADHMKRVNGSIPKGHGEPLEVAKSFALWVAWKRGNEDPPAWAHPDAVLPNKKDDGPPKKLSARALKDMERKEAIAAWRIAPDRQSARVRNAAAAAVAGGGPAPVAAVADAGRAATPAAAMAATTSTSHPGAGENHPPHQYPAFATASPSHSLAESPVMTQSMPFVMNGLPGQHISTPKTSVLGPKRVACDACRKRRIRCKHKDFVTEVDDPNNVSPVWQATPSSVAPADDAAYASPPAPEVLNDTIQVSSLRTARHGNYLSNFVDGHHQLPYGSPDGAYGNGPLPGTNAYVTANIPMTMNGVPIFGDAPKRGRSKACIECRRSKRRCIHDENGQVDPIKAAENPVPRGSVASRKRSGEEDSPTQPNKQARPSFDANEPPQQIVFHQHDSGVNSAMHQLSAALGHHHQHPAAMHSMPAGQPPIDPSLMYADYSHDAGFAPSHPQQQYGMQSLEEIASEVLDMNGHHDGYHHEDTKPPMTHEANHGLLTPGDDATKPDGSVDSAIAMSAHDHVALDPALAGPGTAEAATAAPPVLSAADSAVVSSLPLYRPPPPPSISPELSKRQPILTNEQHTTPTKRKRDSQSDAARPGSSRKAIAAMLSEVPEAERESIELAKALQQDDLGLRKRSR